MVYYMQTTTVNGVDKPTYKLRAPHFRKTCVDLLRNHGDSLYCYESLRKSMELFGSVADLLACLPQNCAPSSFEWVETEAQGATIWSNPQMKVSINGGTPEWDCPFWSIPGVFGVPLWTQPTPHVPPSLTKWDDSPYIHFSLHHPKSWENTSIFQLD